MPDRRQVGFVLFGHQRVLAGDVDADHRSGIEPPHVANRQVVDDATVDQYLAAAADWWQHAWDRDRGAQRAPQRAAVVDHRAPVGEVGGDAVPGQRQILDVALAELAPQQARGLAPGDQ
ncbi:MAG: hypothetical protein DYH17_11660 [Xanthomonadales bacterium PRO6]|nr:hypothetical protein [Xanthomonadales bacterium PRO6]